MASEGDRRAGLEVDESRRSRILGALAGADGRRGVAIALLSTLVFVVVVVVVVANSPGWPTVHKQFFSWHYFKSTLPEIARAFLLNCKIFLIAECLILPFALLIAVLRSLPGPVFFPLRALAIVYADFFRGVPTILVISILALGVPGLELSGVPTSVVFWGIVALVLIYSAYVSEVYRAGIESVHPSQEAAARSLGLSRWQTTPEGDPPPGSPARDPAAPERLHRPAEGHRARGDGRRDRGVQPVADRRRRDVQLHAVPRGDAPLRRDHDPARALHRLPDRTRPPSPAGRGAARVNTAAALQIEGLRKSFGTNLVLDGIDLSVGEHEVTCLIGASGSGKSTLLRCINLLEPVDAGRIVVEGEEITRRGVDVNRVRRRIGIVFQAYNLFPHMSVLENVTLAPRLALHQGRGEAEEQARALLGRFGLSDKVDAYPDHLSGGQQQRVAIVRALAMQPQLMLLDEVTSALDPELVAEVLEVIQELAAGGMTMVIATHEMGFAREIATRVCFLDDGVILEQGPPDQMFGSPRQPRTQQFLQRIVNAHRL